MLPAQARNSMPGFMKARRLPAHPVRKPETSFR